MEYCRTKFIPLEVRLLLPHGWLVGGGARYLTDHTIPETNLPRDWDIVVPLANWSKVSRLIPPGTPSNSFGGLKLTMDNGVVVDLWAMEVADYFLIVDYPEKNGIAVNYSKHMTIRITNTVFTKDGKPYKPAS